MIKKILTSTIAAAVLSCSALSATAEPVSIDYNYSGNTGVNLASIIGGPLSVAAFTDGRADSAASEIQRPGKDALTLDNQTATELLQSAFVKAFTASGAQLGEAGSPLTLNGKIVELQIQDAPQGLETLIRVELTLNNQGRSA